MVAGLFRRYGMIMENKELDERIISAYHKFKVI